MTEFNLLLMIGLDHPHLLSPIDYVRLGPGEVQPAMQTCLGWTFQGTTTLPEATKGSDTADWESVHVVQTQFL